MTPDVVQVKPLPDYCLEARFTSGETRRFDMKPYLRFPAFSALREDGLFMKVHVDQGTVVWNEEIDLSPDTLYLKGIDPEHSV